ncbi:MAG: MurT ligase domain-containing protein [Dehalococcoidia bacterium]
MLLGLRTAAAVMAGKVAAALSRRLGFGGGTALPGLIADAVAPGLAARLAARLGHGCVLITGTNGKTTTARLVRNIAQAAGYWPVHNHSGSNLMRGITACLVEATDIRGRFPQPERRLGVFEVDEATLPEAAAALFPRVIAFTNLFRDQLDRYGEVDSVAAVWRQALAALPLATTVVLNADDPGVASLADACRGPVVFYAVGDASCAVQQIEHAADARWCPACGREYAYSAVFYGHVGHWLCPGCGRARPAAAIEATSVEQGSDHSLSLAVSTPSGQFDLSLPLMGLYNAYNALAAVSVGVALGLPAKAIGTGVASFTAAFGRQERMIVRGREVHTILAKNPAGLNQVLRALSAEEGPKNLLFLLNDDIADGRDVSWIWDVDFEMLAGQAALLMASGRRAADMALRLKYADIDANPTIEENTEAALRKALTLTPEGERLYVIPTYTAMLQVRRLLARWGRRPPFWEEA